MPISERVKKSASARNTSGITTAATTSLPRNVMGSMVTLASNGWGTGSPLKREQAGQEQRAGGQQLREPDRRDGEDETRRLREPTDDHDLDDGPERERGREPDGEAAPPPEADGADGEQDGERRRDGAEVAGGEVDDAVGAPDDGEAEREERAQPADDRALHEDARAGRPMR